MRHQRMIRQLQEENYCLDECSRCSSAIDKHVEYEGNLKFLQVVLAEPGIYRHLFFNYNQRAFYIKECFIFTFAYLIILYWYENRQAHMKEPLWENLPLDVAGLDLSHKHMQRFQSQNLGSLYLYDPRSVVKVLLNDFIFLAFIFLQVFLLKVYQRNNATKSERYFTKELLFWRLWMVLIVS